MSSLSFSCPVSIVSFSCPVVGGVKSFRVVCSDGLVRVGRARFVSADSASALVGAALSGLPVRFGAFAPWSPNRWFSSVESFRSCSPLRSCSLSFDDGISRPWRVVLRAAVKFGLARFGTPEEPMSLSVAFTMGDLLKPNGEMSPRKVLGWMSPVSPKMGTEGDLRTNVVVKCDDKSSLQRVVETLFHEMRHHEQVVRGWVNGDDWKGQDESHKEYKHKSCERDANKEAYKAMREFFADGTIWS